MGISTMHYEVKIVEDCELPSGMPWAITRVTDGAYLFVKRGEITCPEAAARLVSDAWVAWQATGAGVTTAPHLKAV